MKHFATKIVTIQHDTVNGTPCCRSVKHVDNEKLADIICLDYHNSNLKNDIALEISLACMVSHKPLHFRM